MLGLRMFIQNYVVLDTVVTDVVCQVDILA
jgi:hypothetical protein